MRRDVCCPVDCILIRSGYRRQCEWTQWLWLVLYLASNQSPFCDSTGDSRALKERVITLLSGEDMIAVEE